MGLCDRMKVLPLAIVLAILIVSFQAPPTTAEALPITYSIYDGGVHIETENMEAVVSLSTASVTVSYAKEKSPAYYHLSYTGVLLTNSSVPAVSPQPGDYVSSMGKWSLSPPEMASSPYYGSYIRFSMSTALDMIKIPDLHPSEYGLRGPAAFGDWSPPANPGDDYDGNPPVEYPVVKDWGTLAIDFIVTEKSVEASDGSHFSIVGQNELKMNVTVDIRKPLGTSNLVVIQSIASDGPDAGEFMVPDTEHPRKVDLDSLPHADAVMEKMSLSGADRGSIGFSPLDDGGSPALYSWLLSAVRHDSDGSDHEIPVNSFYAGDEGGMIVAFSYSTPAGTVSVLHDPSLEIVPEVIEQTLNFVMEHAVSIMVGAASAVGLSSVVMVLRAARDKDGDSLELSRSHYYRKKE